MAKLVVIGTGIEGVTGELADAIARRVLGIAQNAVLVESTPEWAEEDARVRNYAEYTQEDVDAATAAVERARTARAEHRRLFGGSVTAAERKMSAYLDGDEHALGCGPRD